MKKSILSLCLMGSLLALAACEGNALLWLEYKFTPAGRQADAAISVLERISGSADDSSNTQSNAGHSKQIPKSKDKAPALENSAQLAYVQDASLKQGLNQALGLFELSDKNAASINLDIIGTLVTRAWGDANAQTTWTTETLQSFFGNVTGLTSLWAQKPTASVHKVETRQWMVELHKNQNPSISLIVSETAEDLCRIAGGVLRNQDKIGAEMVNAKGETVTVAHPFGGKACAHDTLQDNFHFISASLSSSHASTREMAVLWKKDNAVNSIWILNYRSGGTKETNSLRHRLESFL